MPKTKIYYFTEDINFLLPTPKAITVWVQEVIWQEGYKLSYLNFIFCSDAHLHATNVKYLQHDTLTDVITFSYAERPQIIEGEIYISIERVTENSAKYKAGFLKELHTVMIHGVLHLLGYNDSTILEKEKMRNKENYYTFLLHK